MIFDGVLAQFGLNVEDFSDVIEAGAANSLSDLDFINLELNDWLQSKKRKKMLAGDSYYKYEPERKQKSKMWGRDSDGAPIWLQQDDVYIQDNQYAIQVDRKVNYVLGKPFTYQTTNEKYMEWLAQVFDKEFNRMISNMTVDVLNCGIAWVNPYFKADGTLSFRTFPGYQVLPFWKDDSHTELDMALRYYIRVKYEGRLKTYVKHVDVYSADGSIRHYILQNGELIEDTDSTPEVYGTQNDMSYKWDRIPLIAFKYNAKEITLLERGKDLQDSRNRVRAGWDTNMTENVHDNIMVIKNYGGENLQEFKDNLVKYGAVKVRDDGGVEVLRIQRDSASYLTYLQDNKNAIIEAFRSFDSKDDRLNGTPNEMNLRSMYADIDLDSDMMETQYQAAFDQLMYFIDEYLKLAGAGDFSADDVTINFDRSMIVNDTGTIANIKASMGLVSSETLLANHPFVKDVKLEQERLKKEQAKQMEQMMAMQTMQSEEDNGS